MGPQSLLWNCSCGGDDWCSRRSQTLNTQLQCWLATKHIFSSSEGYHHHNAHQRKIGEKHLQNFLLLKQRWTTEPPCPCQISNRREWSGEDPWTLWTSGICHGLGRWHIYVGELPLFFVKKGEKMTSKIYTLGGCFRKDFAPWGSTISTDKPFILQYDSTPAWRSCRSGASTNFRTSSAQKNSLRIAPISTL